MKAAVVHYTAQLAHTVAHKGIRANTCSPGNVYIKDGVWGNVEREMPDLFKKQLDLNPSGRFAKPEEIADAVVYLASGQASFLAPTW
jgi:3-oxoacyl-[acyl-carrier protein] reductase